MAGSTCWGCPQHDGKHGQQCPQGRRKGSIATAATRHDVSPPSARGIERTSLVKANLVAANDLTWLYYPPCRWDRPWKTRGRCRVKQARASVDQQQCCDRASDL